MIIKIQKAYDNRTIYVQLTRGVTLLKEVYFFTYNDDYLEILKI